MSDDRFRQEAGWAAASLSCPSGKVVFQTRKSAKAYCRREADRKGNMRPYACDECNGIHVGHLPRAVREGEVSSEEYYGRG